MDGSDMAFDYKAVAAGIARSEGMGALLPVVEKELLHYRILSAMQDGGFFGPIVFQGGTSLRLCHGSRSFLRRRPRPILISSAARAAWGYGMVR